MPSGVPSLEHDYVYEINWSRFGNVTMEKWKKKKIVLEDGESHL